MEDLSIGEIARRAGVRPSTVRYYERLGLLRQPKRVSGQRRYHPDAVQALTVIVFTRRAGFTLAEIRGMLDGNGVQTIHGDQWRESVRQKLAQLDANIEHIQRMKGMLERGLACACRRLDECVIMDRTWWTDVGS